MQAIPRQGAFKHGATPAEDKMRVHVVLAQVYPNGSETGVIGDALPKLEALAVQAAEDGADVIVFPEYFLSGATHHAWHSVRALPALEGHAVAPWVGEVAEIAAKAKIAIVTGSAVQLRSFGNKDEQRLYNTTYFLDRTGTLCGAYTKRNLWHAERDLLTQATKQSHPEDEQPALFVFTTARGLRVRAAMVMCWDLMFPESFRRLMNPQDGTVETADLDQEGRWIGPDIVFAPTCWFADDSGPKALAWNPNCEAACLSTFYHSPRCAHGMPRDGERVLCVHVQCRRQCRCVYPARRPGPVQLQCTASGMRGTRRTCERDAAVPVAGPPRPRHRARAVPHRPRPPQRRRAPGFVVPRGFSHHEPKEGPSCAACVGECAG